MNKKGKNYLLELIFIEDLDDYVSRSSLIAYEIFKDVIEDASSFIKEYELSFEHIDFDSLVLIERGKMSFSCYSDNKYENVYIGIKNFKVDYLELMNSKNIIINKGIKQ